MHLSCLVSSCLVLSRFVCLRVSVFVCLFVCLLVCFLAFRFLGFFWFGWLVVVVAVADVLLLLLMCVRWLYLCGGCGWLLVWFHCLAVWLVCSFGFAWACVGLCVLGGGERVYASNASPCVRSKRFRVYWQHAHMFHTCGLGAGTHADVLNVHTEAF